MTDQPRSDHGPGEAYDFDARPDDDVDPDDVAGRPEDESPLELEGELADPPAETGRTPED